MDAVLILAASGSSCVVYVIFPILQEYLVEFLIEWDGLVKNFVV